MRKRAVTLALLLLLPAMDAGAWPRHHGPPPRRPAAHRTMLPPHVVAPGTIRVHDGDTFYSGDETVRLRGIDAPELGQPGSAAARWRLVQLLHSGPVTIVPRAEDVYGRTIADVSVAGLNVADLLRREGFQKPREGLTRRR